ncbi:hypothetical protein ACFXJ5_33360 [Streptomyces sp. NPDC059373]
MGRDVYGSDWLKAAAMLESTALHEPLEDKNLFFAWLVAEVFLNSNGIYMQYEPEDALALVLRTKHKNAGVQETAAQLRAWATCSARLPQSHRVRGEALHLNPRHPALTS